MDIFKLNNMILVNNICQVSSLFLLAKEEWENRRAIIQMLTGHKDLVFVIK